jgi:hypothetical protein
MCKALVELKETHISDQKINGLICSLIDRKFKKNKFSIPLVGHEYFFVLRSIVVIPYIIGLYYSARFYSLIFTILIFLSITFALIPHMSYMRFPVYAINIIFPVDEAFRCFILNFWFLIVTIGAIIVHDGSDTFDDSPGMDMIVDFILFGMQILCYLNYGF